jgi:ribokinase
MDNFGYDIFGLGQCSLDYIGTIDDFPRADEKCEFSRLSVQGGGPVATALVALARWGLRCYFSGIVGDDPFGDLMTTYLATEGIDTGGRVVRKSVESQFAFVTCGPGRGRRTICWRRPTGGPLLPDEIDYQAIERSKVVHTDGLFIDAALRASAYARKREIPVSVDGGTLREGMLDLARLSDYFIVSETFATALTESGDPEVACRRILELGPRVAAVTLGSRGYVAVCGGTVITQPAYPVAAVDTTGCGDVFHGGFIFGLTRNWDMKKCFDFASWAAAQVSLRIGGRSGIPTLSDIRRRGY